MFLQAHPKGSSPNDKGIGNLFLPGLTFPEACPVQAAVDSLAASGIEARGAIFTRREVVDFILDLVGYNETLSLHEKRFLEPSFGGGDFLLPAASRLIRAWKKQGRRGAKELRNSIRAVERCPVDAGPPLSFERKMEKQEPWTKQDIAAGAFSAWLNKQGDL